MTEVKEKKTATLKTEEKAKRTFAIILAEVFQKISNNQEDDPEDLKNEFYVFFNLGKKTSFEEVEFEMIVKQAKNAIHFLFDDVEVLDLEDEVSNWLGKKPTRTRQPLVVLNKKLKKLSETIDSIQRIAEAGEEYDLLFWEIIEMELTKEQIDNTQEVSDFKKLQETMVRAAEVLFPPEESAIYTDRIESWK